MSASNRSSPRVTRNQLKLISQNTLNFQRNLFEDVLICPEDQDLFNEINNEINQLNQNSLEEVGNTKKLLNLINNLFAKIYFTNEEMNKIKNEKQIIEQESNETEEQLNSDINNLKQEIKKLKSEIDDLELLNTQNSQLKSVNTTPLEQEISLDTTTSQDFIPTCKKTKSVRFSSPQNNFNESTQYTNNEIVNLTNKNIDDNDDDDNYKDNMNKKISTTEQKIGEITNSIQEVNKVIQLSINNKSVCNSTKHVPSESTSTSVTFNKQSLQNCQKQTYPKNIINNKRRIPTKWINYKNNNSNQNITYNKNKSHHTGYRQNGSRVYPVNNYQYYNNRNQNYRYDYNRYSPTYRFGQNRYYFNSSRDDYLPMYEYDNYNYSPSRGKPYYFR